MHRCATSCALQDVAGIGSDGRLFGRLGRPALTPSRSTGGLSWDGPRGSNSSGCSLAWVTSVRDATEMAGCDSGACIPGFRVTAFSGPRGRALSHRLFIVCINVRGLEELNALTAGAG